MLQKVIANYLKCSLGLLEPIDPISVKSSLSVVEILNDGLARSNVAFSVDAEDLFYSISHNKLFVAVCEPIHRYFRITE